MTRNLVKIRRYQASVCQALYTIGIIASILISTRLC